MTDDASGIAQRPPGEERRLAEVRERAARFRRMHVDAAAAELDRRLLLEPEHHPDEVVRRGCEPGLLSLPVPTSLGGQGGLSLDAAVALEELCAGCAGIGGIFGAHYRGIFALLLGTDVALPEAVLGEIARAERRGEPLLCTAAFAEPAAGSCLETPPPAALPVAARKVEGGYVLEGRRAFAGNGGVARWAVVTCALDRARPLETASSFVLERGTRGLSVGRVERTMGQRACPTPELVFEDCFVPDDRRIGAEGEGARLTEVVLAAWRAPAAAAATGVARGAYEIALAFARRRVCGGGSLCDRPWVQQVLAEMRASIELSRRAYLTAAAAFDERIGRPLLGAIARASPGRSEAGPRAASTERALEPTARGALRGLPDATVAACLGMSSLAKLSASDLAVKVCLQATEILGSAGAEERERVEKCLRDAELTRLDDETGPLEHTAVYDGIVRRDGA